MCSHVRTTCSTAQRWTWSFPVPMIVFSSFYVWLHIYELQSTILKFCFICMWKNSKEVSEVVEARWSKSRGPNKHSVQVNLQSTHPEQLSSSSSSWSSSRIPFYLHSHSCSWFLLSNLKLWRQPSSMLLATHCKWTVHPQGHGVWLYMEALV